MRAGIAGPAFGAALLFGSVAPADRPTMAILLFAVDLVVGGLVGRAFVRERSGL